MALVERETIVAAAPPGAERQAFNKNRGPMVAILSWGPPRVPYLFMERVPLVCRRHRGAAETPDSRGLW